MQSNPIQQRIEMICEQWEEAKRFTDARIVRIQCQDDELDMVDTFYTYMIGADTPIHDIAFHFDVAFADLPSFSASLLQELEEFVTIWNDSRKDPRIDFVPVSLKVDYSLRKDRNPARMFVENFNRFARELYLEKNLYAVAIFKTACFNKDSVAWFEQAVKAGIDTSVKFLIHDTVRQPLFRTLARDCATALTTIPLNLNMPKAMEQVAAMGDPKDPATQYRQAFMKMMNAMNAAKEEEAESWGKECITIATQHISRDPYWIMQLVVVNVALGNDKIRYKKKKATISFADAAVHAAVAAQAYFDNDVAKGLMAQSQMFRATVLYLFGHYEEAYPDFEQAYEIYKQQGNTILAIEACRMGSKTAFKQSDPAKAVKLLADGTRLGRVLDRSGAAGSTYAGVLEMLIKSNHTQIIPMAEIDAIATNLFGKDWMKLVVSWKQEPGKNTAEPQAATQTAAY